MYQQIQTWQFEGLTIEQMAEKAGVHVEIIALHVDAIDECINDGNEWIDC